MVNVTCQTGCEQKTQIIQINEAPFSAKTSYVTTHSSLRQRKALIFLFWHSVRPGWFHQVYSLLRKLERTVILWFLWFRSIKGKTESFKFSFLVNSSVDILQQNGREKRRTSS